MITVVSGLPRSGTSMLMQMLDAGGLPPFTDAERAPDASNPRGYYEHERVKALARDNSWLAEAEGHVVKVIAQLLGHLPDGFDYRVAFLERDLDEVLASQAAMLQRLGRPGAEPDVLRPIFERQLAGAQRWLDAHPRATVLYVRHGDVVADPAEQAARLNAFLGGDLDQAAMAAAVDPALHRQRTP
jgi:hypothetical protein